VLSIADDQRPARHMLLLLLLLYRTVGITVIYRIDFDLEYRYDCASLSHNY